MRASIILLALILALILFTVVMIRPVLGLPAFVLTALLIRVEFGTGTAVKISATFILVPVLLGIWAIGSILRRRKERLISSPTLWPLLLFVLSGLLSLLAGNALWDPNVPRSGNLLLVQLTQWAIFGVSAGAFWLTANLIQDIVWLRRLTQVFVVLGSILITLRLVPGISGVVYGFSTTMLIWPASIMLLTALGGGQLLYNRTLSRRVVGMLIVMLGVIIVYSFVIRREDTSVWIGVAAALGALFWLRFPRLHWPLIIGGVVLTAMGVLLPSIYNFAGGEKEWLISGGSRLLLIERVVEVTMHNPITGLGPAAYRSYAALQPLAYGGAYWLQPAVNSHNNYVDLFAHVGLLGLALLAWFAVAFARTGLLLRRRHTEGFAAGYVNGILAAGCGSLVLMLFADWILPHVYNIGFDGFQASVLVWLFMGGLVVLENMGKEESPGECG